MLCKAIRSIYHSGIVIINIRLLWFKDFESSCYDLDILVGLHGLDDTSHPASILKSVWILVFLFLVTVSASTVPVYVELCACYPVCPSRSVWEDLSPIDEVAVYSHPGTRWFYSGVLSGTDSSHFPTSSPVVVEMGYICRHSIWHKNAMLILIQESPAYLHLYLYKEWHATTSIGMTWRSKAATIM